MANLSKDLQHRILQFKYRRGKEYDLYGDRVDTDEFIYDSDISVEDKVPTSRQRKFVGRDIKREATSDKVRGVGFNSKATSVTISKKASRAAPGMSALTSSGKGSSIPSDGNVRLVPDASVDGRKIEELTQLPIFLDGSVVAATKYEAVFDTTNMQ